MIKSSLKKWAAVVLAAVTVGVVALVPSPVRAGSEEGMTIKDIAVAVNAATGEFDHLLAAVQRANLVGALDGKRQLTVFAPTDEAFEALFEELGVSSVDEIDLTLLTNVLLYHVAPGERFAEDVVSASQVRMLNKQFAPVEGTTIAGAPILATDIDASNGVIHIIGAVMLPPKL